MDAQIIKFLSIISWFVACVSWFVVIAKMIIIGWYEGSWTQKLDRMQGKGMNYRLHLIKWAIAAVVATAFLIAF